MLTVSISEFRANLGEEITVCSNGRILAKISALLDQKDTAKGYW